MYPFEELHFCVQETQNFLSVVNNLLGPDQQVLQDSQLTANTSGR